ncbi:MAG: Asp-tRNA(Asn)/Glu-tRNA(Gln) amidotransferase GatCAB subunit B, partial [Verrucomicrobia bacterium]|nr:Asp-tRNA(Asn)/Glu-tRNA(Gln) amidotransferase GatCAB subunit B [Verrucomicrobiota bacterium]
TPTALAELAALIEKGTISGRQGKEVFAEMMSSGKAPAAIVQEKGMQQVSDTGALEGFCDEAIAAHPAVVADFKAGKEAALNFLKGQVMKLSKGKANPALVGDILKKKLSA